MISQYCPNCEAEIKDQQKFCAECGQKFPVYRFTLRNFFHEFLHAFTHADRGIFHLLFHLSTKPGVVAREYVKGKRKKYFSPFTFFLIVMALFVFTNNVFKGTPIDRKTDPRVIAYIPTEEGKQKYIGLIHRANVVDKFTHKNGNMVAMIAIPFISFFTWLFFRKKKYNYAEHLIANILFIAFSNLVFALTVFPLQNFYKGTPLYNYLSLIGLLAQTLYLWWALNGFLQMTTVIQRIKTFVVSLVCIIAWMLLSLTLIALYIYQGKDFYQFFEKLLGL